MPEEKWRRAPDGLEGVEDPVVGESDLMYLNFYLTTAFAIAAPSASLEDLQTEVLDHMRSGRYAEAEVGAREVLADCWGPSMPMPRAPRTF